MNQVEIFVSFIEKYCNHLESVDNVYKFKNQRQTCSQDFSKGGGLIECEMVLRLGVKILTLIVLLSKKQCHYLEVILIFLCVLKGASNDNSSSCIDYFDKRIIFL